MTLEAEAASDWTAYNRTPWGRLRLDLAHHNLERWLAPRPGRVLDAGCGSGETVIWLAEQGHKVTAIDKSPDMVDVGRAAAEERGVHVEWIVGDITTTSVSRDFDLVLCHNVLGYVPDPEAMCAALANRVAPGGSLSLIISNLLARPLQIAALEGDLRAAMSAAQGERSRESSVCRDALAAQTPAEVRGWIADNGLSVTHQGGIRVVNDYIDNDVKKAAYPDLLALEAELSARAPYNEIGVLVHLLATRR